MATDRDFNSMLNEYLPYDLLTEEITKRDWLIGQIEKDQNWKGGNLVVPFRGGAANSFSYGALTAEADISKDTYVRGNVADYKELWGSMIWDSRDLVEHGSVEGQSSGIVSEQSFLRELPRQLDGFMDRMKQVTSVNLLSGTHFAAATVDGDASGNITVDHPERFEVNTQVTVEDNDTGPVTGWVNTAGGININTGVINLTTLKDGGGVAVDLSLYTVAAEAKVFYAGAEAASGNAFTPLRDQLLSAANGGSAALFGVTKLDYPFLQAIQIDGSATPITAANILTELFDGWNTVNKLGKGRATKAVMSYDKLGAVMKLLETSSGPFRHIETKADTFGWTTITVVGTRGALEITGVQEMSDTEIYFLDMSAMKLCSNGMFRMERDPEGKLYFTVRATTGYRYIVDVALFGELIVDHPSHCGVIHSVTATL